MVWQAAVSTKSAMPVVFVKSGRDRVVECDYLFNNTLSHLKKSIRSELGIPPHQQRFLHQGGCFEPLKQGRHSLSFLSVHTLSSGHFLNDDIELGAQNVLQGDTLILLSHCPLGGRRDNRHLKFH